MKKRFVTIILLAALFVVSLPCVVYASGVYTASIPEDVSLYNGHSYKVFTQKKSWTDAKAYCESLGGHLVTITSQEEQDFVAGLVTNKNVAAWIGASWTTDQFVWVTGETFDYTNWDQGEPSYDFSSSKEPYVGIYANNTDTEYSTTGMWNDFRASTETIKGFVCEWDPRCVASDGQVFDSHLNLNWNVTIEPTCTKAGTREQKCERCLMVVATEQIDALGHSFGDWQVIAGNKLIPPIVKEHRCNVCSYTEIYKDWGYVWVPIVSIIAVIGVAIGLVSYVRAFKRR